MLPLALSQTGWSEQPPVELLAPAVSLWPHRAWAACPVVFLCKQQRLASEGFCYSIPVCVWDMGSGSHGCLLVAPSAPHMGHH